MADLAYSFRPSLLQPERTVRLDGGALHVRDGDKPERHIAWSAIDEVHIQPVTAGDDARPRWVIRLGVKNDRPVRIELAHVRGIDDFEHKTDEFSAVLAAIHAALLPRRNEVKFLYGMGSGLNLGWRIALVLTVAVGLFGTVAALLSGEWEALFGTLAFAATGISGLSMLRGRRGPVAYDPAGADAPEIAGKAAGCGA